MVTKISLPDFSELNVMIKYFLRTFFYKIKIYSWEDYYYCLLFDNKLITEKLCVTY